MPPTQNTSKASCIRFFVGVSRGVFWGSEWSSSFCWRIFCGFWFGFRIGQLFFSYSYLLLSFCSWCSLFRRPLFACLCCWFCSRSSALRQLQAKLQKDLEDQRPIGWLVGLLELLVIWFLSLCSFLIFDAGTSFDSALPLSSPFSGWSHRGDPAVSIVPSLAETRSI